MGEPAEHPILFAAPMVRAILAGTKTQTRRLIRRLPDRPVLFSVDIEALVEGCPYGQRGDRLWVREAFANSRGDDSMPTHYRADEKLEDIQRRWRPSIHMPRWASRLTLEVETVRVGRLQDISEADIIAEGVTVNGIAERTGVPWSDIPDLFAAWRLAWDSINAKRAPWASNPWVWAVSFRRIVGAP